MKLKAQLEGSDISKNAALWLMAGLLLLAFLLAAMGWDWDVVSTDELAALSDMGAFQAPKRPLEILSQPTQFSANMPLYFVVGGFWAQATGFSHITLRLLGALLALLAVANLYRLAADMIDRRLALTAALLFIFNPLTIKYLHHIRQYSMLMLMVTTHTWLYWRLLHATCTGRGLWLAFILSCGLSLYSHGLAGALYLGLVAHHLLFVRRTRRFWMILLAWLAGLALFVPYAPDWVSDASVISVDASPSGFGMMGLATTLGLTLSNQMAILWLPLGLGVALGLRRNARGALARLLCMALVIVAALAAIDAVKQTLDWNRMRYFLVMWHFAMIMFAFALWSLPWRRVVLPLFVAIWIYGGMRASQPGFVPDHPYVVRSEYSLPPLHDYVRQLRGQVNALDYVIGFERTGLIYIESRYFDVNFIDYYFGSQLGIDSIFFHESDKKYRLKGDVGDILTTRLHLLLAHDPSAEPPNYGPTRHFIEEQFAPCPPLVDEPTLRIQRFRHPARPCDHAPAAVIEYDNGTRLIDRAVRYDTDTNAIQALLWWEIPDESMLDDFNISLQVFDSNGDKAAQNDYHLDASLTPWGLADLAAGHLPDGLYELRLILYNRHDGAKVSGIDEATGVSMALLPLFDFEKVARRR